MTSCYFFSHTFCNCSGDENQKTGSPGFNTGVTQLLELTSFRGTEKHSAHDVSQKIEMFGGMMQCISSRENIIYCIDTLRVNAEQSIELMADSVIKPRVLQEDIDEAKEIIALQSQALAADVASREALHIAAYNGSPMGNVHLCPEDQLSHLNLALLEKFRKDHVFGSNIVVSGAGIDHDLFVDMVKTKFAAIPGGKTKPPRAKSVYTGGMHAVQRELREPFVKVAIGFEFATGWKDEKTLIAGIVLQTLLGGGSSFSAGGPGKGMYTRLYREVLNRYHWVESAESLLNIFDDSAMLAIDIACPEDSVGGSIQIIVTHFWLLATQLVTDEELNRAKNMAKSSLLMQLESRLVTCEDIARQVAVFGHRKDVLATCKLIDAVTPQDILDIGRRMLKSVPAVAVTGPNLQIPTFEAIHDYIKAKAASI